MNTRNAGALVNIVFTKLPLPAWRALAIEADAVGVEITGSSVLAGSGITDVDFVFAMGAGPARCTFAGVGLSVFVVDCVVASNTSALVLARRRAARVKLDFAVDKSRLPSNENIFCYKLECNHLL